MSSKPTRHLDLGCGPVPRDPYQRDGLFGIDIALRELPGVFDVLAGNLSLRPIPFDADHFGSVSAFDFFEQVPRVLATADGQKPPGFRSSS